MKGSPAGFVHFSGTEMIQFVTDFAEALYHVNSALWLFSGNYGCF